MSTTTRAVFELCVMSRGYPESPGPAPVGLRTRPLRGHAGRGTSRAPMTPDHDTNLQIEHPGLEREMAPKVDHGEDSYRGSGRLTGRKALITGGDSGIGRAVAIAFAREGADVVISHLPEEQPDADETVRVVEASGRRALSLPGDVTDRTYREQLVEQTVAELGGIDILVNNAAYQMAHEGLEDLGDD